MIHMMRRKIPSDFTETFPDYASSLDFDAMKVQTLERIRDNLHAKLREIDEKIRQIRDRIEVKRYEEN